MTEDELCQELGALQASILIDDEIAHRRADRLLCDFLVSLGFSKVVEEYEKIDKWYA